MKALFAAAGLPLCLSFAAAAQGSVPAGLWSYEANAALGPLPIEDAGTHCIEETAGETGVETLLNDINQNCHVTESAVAADGYHFTMTCAGGPDGELDGRLRVEGETAQLNATGWTGNPDSPVPVSLIASARRLAPSCS